MPLGYFFILAYGQLEGRLVVFFIAIQAMLLVLHHHLVFFVLVFNSDSIRSLPSQV